jgi:hypothetical protein
MKQDDYWNDFYSEWNHQPPSQFAAFVLSEFDCEKFSVFDLGCGNGRDSRFFAMYGNEVLASDGSSLGLAAIDRGSPTKSRIQREVVDYGDEKAFRRYLEKNRNPSKRSLYYGRFLLHALDDESLMAFTATLGSAAMPGDLIALEFRTRRDNRLIGKVTPKHFRRGLDLHEVLKLFDLGGFEVLVCEEGFGYARYRTDDAHVGRIVLEKTS